MHGRRPRQRKSIQRRIQRDKRPVELTHGENRGENGRGLPARAIPENHELNPPEKQAE
jgi:hypothetical protein